MKLLAESVATHRLPYPSLMGFLLCPVPYRVTDVDG